MSRKKKQKRKKPRYKKNYDFNLQDDLFIKQEGLLQDVHGLIAKEILGEIPKSIIGDWVIKTEGVSIYIDPELGAQAEIEGTQKLPLSKRVKIHIWLLKFLRSGCSILKAVKKCFSMYQTL